VSDEIHDIIHEAIWAYMPFRKPTPKHAEYQTDAVRRMLKEAGYVIVKPLRISAEDARYLGREFDYPEGRDNIKALQKLGLPIELEDE
jgi:hypothetical protein